MAETKKAPLTVRLSPSVLAALRKNSEKTGMKIQAIVEYAVRVHLAVAK